MGVICAAVLTVAQVKAYVYSGKGTLDSLETLEESLAESLAESLESLAEALETLEESLESLEEGIISNRWTE